MPSTQSPSKPLLPWKTRLSISFLSTLTDVARRPDGTVNRRLMNFLDRKAIANPKPVNGVSSSDVTVDPDRNLWFRIFTPTTTAATLASVPVIVFFHGGGFSFLSPASFAYDAVCRRFARKIPAVVISVNYRLCPEHRYPSQYNDGFDVLQFLDENGAVLPDNADLTKLILAGDSAGANLAHHVAVRVCRSRLRKIRVIGLISIQPFFGGEERTEAEIQLTGVPLVSVPRTDWMWNAMLPDGANRDHEAVNGLDYPDTIVFVGGFDPLKDWQRRYYEWLRKSGKEAKLIEYPNTIHAFYVFPELPESSQLITEVKDFINKRMSKM
ncbi:putative carboxylesterase 18 [Senna tora]|uniref:Putative carboxylesterase 18 n=1 Tax=Senna tora TaxID=362788 RepID=A0A834T317_9FABA|nr:putative carboxylesterase 18 [Senna tora]